MTFQTKEENKLCVYGTGRPVSAQRSLVARRKKFHSLQTAHDFKEPWKEGGQGSFLLQILQVSDL